MHSLIFIYNLWIYLTRDPKQYIINNIIPLVANFKWKSGIWCCFSLVVGRCNLMKIIWMPQLLYILHNSPVWIYKKWFKKIDTRLKEFIWKNGLARIHACTLQIQKGRLALPHPWSYFLATQLQHVEGNNIPGGSDAGRGMMLLNTPHNTVMEADFLP